MLTSKSVLFTLASAAIVASAHANLIGLLNTGTAGDGSLLPSGSVQPGWSILQVTPPNPPGGLTPPTPPSSAFVVDPYGYWTQPSPQDPSKWLSYSTPLYIGGDIYREFMYTLTFQADKHDSFWLRLSADNGSKVFLNGTDPQDLLYDLGNLNTGNFTPFQSWTTWIEVDHLNDGFNTLAFDVRNLSQNYLNPTGLRVEFSLEDPYSAPQNSVPDTTPTAAAMTLSLSFLLALRHKRQPPRPV